MSERQVKDQLEGIAGAVSNAAVRWFERSTRRLDDSEGEPGLELNLTVGTGPNVVEVRLRVDVRNATDVHTFDVSVQFHLDEGTHLDSAATAEFVRHYGAPTVVGFIRSALWETATTFDTGRIVLPFHVEAFIVGMSDEELAAEVFSE